MRQQHLRRQNTPALGSNPTRQLIVEMLSAEWPLTARAIYSRLVKKHRISVTYQAVHKALKEMTAQRVISRDGNGYSINMEWANQVSEFGERIKKSRESPLKETKQAFETSFSTLFSFYLFCLDELEKNMEEGGNKAACFIGPYTWNPMPMSGEEERRLSSVAGKIKIYGLSLHNTKFDEMLKKAWESFGIRMKIGVSGVPDFNMCIIGDKIYYMHYPPELLENIQGLYRRIKDVQDIDITEINRDMMFKNCRIYVLINENKAVADIIRKWTAEQFEKNES